MKSDGNSNNSNQPAKNPSSQFEVGKPTNSPKDDAPADRSTQVTKPLTGWKGVDFTKKIEIILGSFIALFTCVMMVANIYQIKASRQANEISKSNTQFELKPYIFVLEPYMVKSNRIEIIKYSIENFGNTPAEITSMVIRARRDTAIIEDDSLVEWSKMLQPKTPFVIPARSAYTDSIMALFPPWMMMQDSLGRLPNLTPTPEWSVKARDYLFGKIVWRDVFGNSDSMKFCWVYVMAWKRFYKKEMLQ